MPCECKQTHCPECMGGWTPPPPAEVGSARWKHKVATSYCTEKGYFNEKRGSSIIKLPTVDGHDLGYMAIRHSSSGWDYFRVDEVDEA